MSPHPFNRYRAAIEVLQRGRDLLVDELADQVLDQADDLVEGGFAFNEFLEREGTRLHFLALLVSQLEQSADSYDEAHATPPPPPIPEEPKPKKRRSRAKKVSRPASAEEPAEEG